MSDSTASIAVGDRVRLWVGPPKMGGWQYGEVTGIDNGSRAGVTIRFDHPVKGQPTCYATHAEVERVTPPAPPPRPDPLPNPVEPSI